MNMCESNNLVNKEIVEKLISLNVKYDKRVMFLFSKIYHKSGLGGIIDKIPSRSEKDRVLVEGFKLFCSEYKIHLDKLSKVGRDILLYRYGFIDGNFKTYQDILSKLNTNNDPDFGPSHVEFTLNSHLTRLASKMVYCYVNGKLFFKNDYQKTKLSFNEKERRQKEGVKLIEAEARKYNRSGKITTKELQEFAATIYCRRRGITHYSLKGWLLNYNISNEALRSTVKVIVDLRLNEVIDRVTLKRYDPKGVCNA